MTSVNRVRSRTLLRVRRRLPMRSERVDTEGNDPAGDATRRTRRTLPVLRARMIAGRLLVRLISIPKTISLFIAGLMVVMTVLFVIGRDGRGRSVTSPTADAAYYYVYLPSVVFDHDMDFSNQYEVTKNQYHLRDTPTGQPGNVFGVGPAIFEFPGFAVGHGVAIISGSRSDGFSEYEEFLSLWMGIPFTIGAILLAAKVVSRRSGGRMATLVGAAMVAVSGPVVYYAVRQPGYAHPYATFAVALLVERWDAWFEKGARSLRTWCVLGAALGLAMLARPQLVTWDLLLLVAAGDDIRQRGETPRHRLLMRWMAALSLCMLVFCPQIIAWACLYGAPFTVPQGPGFMRWDSPAIVDVLFSSRNGLFPWAPLYLPMLLGLYYLRPRRRIAIALLAGFGLQVVVNGAAWDWWGGGSYGGRRFDSAYVVFAVGGAALADRLARAVKAGVTQGFPLVWRTRPMVAVASSALACVIAAAELQLAMETSVTSVRITGGEAPSDVWKRQAGVVGYPAGWLAGVESLPAALIFAIRYGVPLDAYDKLEGTFYLGETFPGLNSTPDKVVDTVPFDESSWIDFDLPAGTGPRRVAVMTGSDASVLIGLNRRGSVTVHVRVESTAPVTIAWNGVEIEASPQIRPNTARKIACCLTPSSNAFMRGARRSSTMFGIFA